MRTSNANHKKMFISIRAERFWKGQELRHNGRHPQQIVSFKDQYLPNYDVHMTYREVQLAHQFSSAICSRVWDSMPEKHLGGVPQTTF